MRLEQPATGSLCYLVYTSLTTTLGGDQPCTHCLSENLKFKEIE